METIFDAYVSFPATSEYSQGTLDRLVKLCESVELLEQYFNIEFSCGDGKYLSDIEDDPKELELYDGNVCYNYAPRERDDGKEFKLNTDYNFTIKSKETKLGDEVTFFINNKVRSKQIIT